MTQSRTQKLSLVRPDQAPPVWAALRNEAAAACKAEPPLASLLDAVILCHGSLGAALSFQLARKLGDAVIPPISLREIHDEAQGADPSIVSKAEADMRAVFERDPACKGYLQPFLFFKGFLALQTYRVSHWLWEEGRETLAFYMQSRTSELFQVDIHPAARIGAGVFIDHATGVVIGETAVVGDDVSMLHGVTLGGTGADRGDRHPKIGKGVLLGAGRQGAGQHPDRRLRQDRVRLCGAEARARLAAPPRACRPGWSTAPTPAKRPRAPWTILWPTSFTTIRFDAISSRVTEGDRPWTTRTPSASRRICGAPSPIP